jgi:hypothetical protein
MKASFMVEVTLERQGEENDDSAVVDATFA